VRVPWVPWCRRVGFLSSPPGPDRPKLRRRCVRPLLTRGSCRTRESPERVRCSRCPLGHDHARRRQARNACQLVTSRRFRPTRASEAQMGPQRFQAPGPDRPTPSSGSQRSYRNGGITARRGRGRRAGASRGKPRCPAVMWGGGGRGIRTPETRRSTRFRGGRTRPDYAIPPGEAEGTPSCARPATAPPQACRLGGAGRLARVDGSRPGPARSVTGQGAGTRTSRVNSPRERRPASAIVRSRSASRHRST
jgi:hypothetical protein